jgi:hypothetical protein
VNTSKKEEISIDLDNTLKIIKKTIQPEAEERLAEILDNFKKRNKTSDKVNELDSWKKDFYIERSNNTIFINGERGAGKTTFLRSQLLSMLEDDKDEILPIALIDPTLVETHQHILVDIIAKLSELVRSKFSCCGNESDLANFNEKLEAMAEGLRLLQSKEKNKDQDASWFLNKALRNAIGGQTLEQKFHALIDTSSRILDQNIFVIAFDDVDTDTTKAFEVLELIRRYLSHSKIVTLISGDIKLYSHIVKNKKTEEFSTKDGIDSSVTNELTDHLEQQYLAKVFPVDQRIELKNLFELGKNKKYTFRIKDDVSSGVELTEYIDGIISKTFFVDTKNDKKQFVQFFLQQPLRTILQTLKVLKSDQQSSKNYPLQMAKSMKDSYTGIYRNVKINAEDLSQQVVDSTKIGLAMFNLCHRFAELETGFYGRPDSQEPNYNIAQFFLASVTSAYLNAGGTEGDSASNNFGNCLSFMLTAGASCNIFVNYVAENIKESSKAEDYINYLGLNRNQTSFSVAAHFSPLFFQGLKSGTSGNQKHLRAGVARTPKRVRSSLSIKSALVDIYKVKEVDVISKIGDLDSQYYDQSLLTKLAIDAILIASHSIITKAEGRDYASIFCLLAGIAELAMSDDVEATFSRLTSLQTYAAPTFIKGIDEGSEDEGDEDEDDINQSKENKAEAKDEVIDLLKKWKSNIKIEKSVSPLLCGKIWTRSFYTTIKISEFKKIKLNGRKSLDITLHEFFSRLVLGLVNSFLIEEVRYGSARDQRAIENLRKAKNVAETPRELFLNIKNLRSAFGNDTAAAIAAIPMTRSLICCPLLWPFLIHHADDDVNDFFKEVIATAFENPNSYFKELKATKIYISSLPIIGCNTATSTPKSKSPKIRPQVTVTKQDKQSD